MLLKSAILEIRITKTSIKNNQNSKTERYKGQYQYHQLTSTIYISLIETDS